MSVCLDEGRAPDVLVNVGHDESHESGLDCFEFIVACTIFVDEFHAYFLDSGGIHRRSAPIVIGNVSISILVLLSDLPGLVFRPRPGQTRHLVGWI